MRQYQNIVSQGDSRFNCALTGARVGGFFIGFDEVVLDADINAALNILARLYDDEINLYTPKEEVRRILIRRAKAVLSSVETAQPRLQPQAAVNVGLYAKSELSKNVNQHLAIPS